MERTEYWICFNSFNGIFDYRTLSLLKRDAINIFTTDTNNRTALITWEEAKKKHWQAVKVRLSIISK